MATPEDPQKAEQALIDKAYNTPGFLEFMAEHPDAKDFDSTDVEAVAARMETFEVQAAVAKGIAETFNNHIAKELGIEIDALETREEIKAYIMSKAVENPAEVLHMRDVLETTVSLKSEIVDLEHAIGVAGSSAEHQQTLDDTKDNLSDLEKADKASGLIGGTLHALKRFGTFITLGKLKSAEGVHEITEAKARVEQLHGPTDSGKRERLIFETKARIDELNEKFATAKSLEDRLAIVEQDFAALRTEILTSASDSTELTELLQTAVKNQFTEITSKSTLAELVEAQEKFDALTHDNATGIDVLGQDPTAVQDFLDAKIENKVAEMVKDAVKNVDVNGGRALDRLKKELKEVISAEKLGSKESDEMKTFIKEELVAASDSLKKDTSENRMKQLIIRRIIDTL